METLRLGADEIARAAEILRAGGLVAFPTETVYGLGADALNAAAIARIYEAKGRPAINPLIVHVADLDEARALVAAWPDAADVLAAACWPGPLTLVLEKNDRVPSIATAGGSTIAVRVPAHPIALALLRATTRPLAAPSANFSSSISPTTAAHVRASLDGRIDAVIDGGACAVGIESTVVSLVGRPMLLRAGGIPVELIERLIGPIGRAPAIDGAGATLPSPGMMERHYAPKARVELLRSGDDEERVRALVAQGTRVGWIAIERPGERASIATVARITHASKPTEYAAALYASLHTLDAAGVEVIVIESPPTDDAWLAVNDRLRRAAHR